MSRGKKVMTRLVKTAVKARVRSKSSSKTGVGVAMSLLHKEMEMLKSALQTAQKKAKAAQKEAQQFGSQAAHKVAKAALTEKAKLEKAANELGQKIKAMHLGERIEQLEAKIKHMEAVVEEKVKYFQKQLADKTSIDLEKAVAAFKKRWHQGREKTNAKRVSAKRKQLMTQAKRTVNKVGKQVKKLKTKTGAAVKKTQARKTTVKKNTGRRGRPSKA